MTTTEPNTSNNTKEMAENDSKSSKQNQEIQWIDDAFQVYKTRFGLWHSEAKNGEKLISSLSEEQCVKATRFYLKGRQEGWDGSNSNVMNDGIVGGKL
jgi:hypothetical protein